MVRTVEVIKIVTLTRDVCNFLNLPRDICAMEKVKIEKWILAKLAKRKGQFVDYNFIEKIAIRRLGINAKFIDKMMNADFRITRHVGNVKILPIISPDHDNVYLNDRIMGWHVVEIEVMGERKA